MKLVRYGRAGAEKPGLVDATGAVRDLSRLVKDITADVLAPSGLERLRAVKVERLPIVRGRPRLGCPLSGIGKMVCIGLNYGDHAREVGRPTPDEPTLFIKATSAINGPNDAIVQPRGATKLDYEVKLAAVTGRDARNVSEADAMKHVAAYTIVNDVSERAFQMERGGTTTKGKSADHSRRSAPGWSPRTRLEIHDLFGPDAGRVRQPVHVAARGRPDLDRHPRRRRARDDAAALSAARRRRRDGDHEARRADVPRHRRLSGVCPGPRVHEGWVDDRRPDDHRRRGSDLSDDGAVSQNTLAFRDLPIWHRGCSNHTPMNVRGRALRAAPGSIAIAGADAVYCRRLLHNLRAGNETRPIVTMAVSDDLADQLAAAPPSIILFDLGPNPDADALTVVSAVSAVAKTVVLAGTDDDALAVGALNAGAAGVGLRDTPPDVLRRGIQIVDAGEIWVGRPIMVRLIKELAVRSPAACAVAGAERLTPRERDLVALVAKGASNKDIAQRLSISVKTVKTHMTNIFRKLGLSTRLELALAVGRSPQTNIG